MVDDQSDNKIYHITVYGNKTTVNVKPRAHVRKCFPATLISLVVINIDCPQHQEDINIFRTFVKTSEEYYEADKALHLFQPAPDKVSLTAIHSIERLGMTGDPKTYMATLRKQHIFVTGDKDETLFCMQSLLDIQSYSNICQIIGNTLAIKPFSGLFFLFRPQSPHW